MDANGTRFHVLLGKADWGRSTDDRGLSLDKIFAIPPLGCNEDQPGFDWNDDGAEVSLRSCLFEFQAAPLDRRVTPADRRGAARDRYGNVYWIGDSAREIRVNSAGTGITSVFWPVASDPPPGSRERFGAFGPAAPRPAITPVPLRGLAVTDDHYLVVGVIDPKGLLIFDLHAGGPPRHVRWPNAVTFSPWDMAARPGGGVWILDRENRRYWALDRHLHVVADEQLEAASSPGAADDFQPVDRVQTRQSARAFPAGIELSLASPLAASDPLSIESLPDGTVLILDRNPDAPFSLILRYRFGLELVPPLSLEPFAVVGHDLAFVPDASCVSATDRTSGMLYIVGADGNQARAFTLSGDRDRLGMALARRFLPMRLFGGKALIAANRHLYYDLGDGWIPLVEQLRPRYARAASLVTPAFDGRDPECVWHRLLLDACIPPGTSVSVESRAANELRDLAVTNWQREPQPYLRGDGSELPFTWSSASEDLASSTRDPVQPVPTPSSGEGKGTWELLFQDARGRYLQLRLTLSGNARSSPRLRALRAYYPRFSYLERYLPAVYREEPQSASFLDRFLANIEGFYTTLEDRIASVQMLFDMRSAPPDTLEWLASWFGVALDPAWSESKRRLFIRHAMDFFQYRGTARGLRLAVRLATEPAADDSLFAGCATSGVEATGGVRIVEKFRTRRAPGAVFGDPTDTTGPRLVSLEGRWRPDQGRATLIKRYIDSVKPATPGPGEVLDFPIKAPAEAAAWRQFSSDTLGFVPMASSTDLPAWRDFLARRYQRVSALNDAYKPANPLTAFSDASLPDALPTDGPALRDWYQFESVVLAMRRSAHRFSVLLPVRSAGLTTDDQRGRLDLTRRVIELEKPAHTIFDVKFYWAMFRLGEARLGDDTLIDLGGRAPELMAPMTLGQGHLAESYLAPSPPQSVKDRTVPGRCDLLG